jgi:hypothetical protein
LETKMQDLMSAALEVERMGLEPTVENIQSFLAPKAEIKNSFLQVYQKYITFQSRRVQPNTLRNIKHTGQVLIDFGSC